MSGTQTKRLSMLVFGALLMAMLFAVGCSDQAILDQPDNSTQPQLLTRSAKAAAVATSAGDPLYIESVVSDASGGTVALYDVMLEIPAGAVGNDTLFSISIPDPLVFFNEFGTHGLVFNNPVKVTMSYRDANLIGVDESSIRIVWLDERDGTLKDIDCVIDRNNKTVTGFLNHFSAYGLVSD